MTRSMSEAQQRKRNAQEFRRTFTILHQAAIGVTQVRTKEPFRAIEALRDFAFADSMEFKLWTILQGWQTYDKQRPTDEPTADNLIEPLAALKAITGMGGGEGFSDRGVYVMMHPHKPLAQHIGMVQCIKEYAKTFSSGYRRLVLLTPYTYTLPEELQDDVVILDFDPPSYAELKDIYDKLINDVPQARRPRYTEDEVDQIINNGAGMTKQEFENAVSRALVSRRAQLPNIPLAEFSGLVSEVKTEVVKRSEVLELMEPDDIRNIGGLDNLKAWITKRRSAFSQDARDFGVEPPKGIALIGPPGCQPAGSKVLIADGTWKNVEEVVEGDVLMSPQRDGTNIPVPVVETLRYENRAVYRVTTTGRGGERSYLCSHNHILPMLVLNRPGPHGERKRVTELAEMSVDDFLSRGETFRQKARVFTTPAFDLPDADLPVHPYVLGALLGDGNLTELLHRYDAEEGYGNRLRFFNADSAVIARMEACGVVFSSRRWDQGHWACEIADGPVKDGMRRLGLMGYTSRDKFVPEDYMRGSLNQRLELLAGLIDTDGTFECFSTKSEVLARDVCDLIHSIGGVATYRARTTTCNGRKFNSFRVSYSTAEHEIPCTMDHKRRGPRDIDWKNPRNTSFKVEYVGEDTVYGFTLGFGSQWYVTDDWLVTHNTGKTASGKAISSVLGIPMLKFDVGRVFQSLVGQSEERVRNALKLVDTMAPCVLLIDEVDKMFQVGSGGDSGVGQRVLGTMLTWMQETKSPVFLIVTANRTENLPSEFLRRGRLDEVFNVTVPNEVERLEIMKIHLRKRKQDPEAITGLEEAVERSNGYVSAEIEAAVKDAIIEAFTTNQPVTGALIAEQFQYMVPLSVAFKEQFDRMAEWAQNNARPASVAPGEEVGKAVPRVRQRSRIAPATAVAGRSLALDS